MAKITSIESLDNEISRLQEKAKVLEGRLDESLDYLQDNYSSMIMNSVVSKVAASGFKNGIAGTFLGFILTNEKLGNALSKIVNDLVNKAATGMDKLAEKITKKKKDEE